MTSAVRIGTLAVLVVIAAASFTTGIRAALAPGRSQDLAAVYMAARVWLHGSDPYAGRSNEQWRAEVGATEIPEFDIARAYSTPYPPIALTDIAPFSGVEWEAARRVWLVINVALALAVPFLIGRIWFPGWSRWTAAAVCALWLGGMGLRVGIGNGQHALWWFVTTLVAFLALRHRREWLAGVPLALSLHKYSLTAPLVPFLILRRYITTTLAMMLVALALLAIFLLHLHAPASTVIANYGLEMSYWWNQSKMGELPGFGVTHVSPVVQAVLGDGAGVRVAVFCLLAVATAATWWPSRSSSLPGALDVSCILVLTLIAGYHAVYDTVVLILPIVCLASERQTRATPAARIGCTVLLSMLVAVWYLDAGNTARILRALGVSASGGWLDERVMGLAYRGALLVTLSGLLALRWTRPVVAFDLLPARTPRKEPVRA